MIELVGNIVFILDWVNVKFSGLELVEKEFEILKEFYV